MKKRIIVWIVALFFVFFTGCSRDYLEVLYSNWKISIPQEANCKMVYEDDAPSSFNGDGFRYHVFEYEESGEDEIATMVTWSETEGKMNFHDGYKSAVEEWLGTIDVPTKESPDYTNCKYYYQNQSDMSELLIIWNSEQNKLYIVESFL